MQIRYIDPLFEAEERGDQTAKQKRMERNKLVPPETKGAPGAGQKLGGPATAQPPQGQPPPANAPKKEPTLEEIYDFIGELKREAGKLRLICANSITKHIVVKYEYVKYSRSAPLREGRALVAIDPFFEAEDPRREIVVCRAENDKCIA